MGCLSTPYRDTDASDSSIAPEEYACTLYLPTGYSDRELAEKIELSSPVEARLQRCDVDGLGTKRVSDVGV